MLEVKSALNRIRSLRIANISHDIHQNLLDFCFELDKEGYPEATLITKGKYKTLYGLKKLYERILKNKKHKRAKNYLKRAEEIILGMSSLHLDVQTGRSAQLPPRFSTRALPPEPRLGNTSTESQFMQRYRKYYEEYLASDMFAGNILDSKKEKIARDLAILRIAQEDASETYGRPIRVFLCGGSVRDLVRGKTPNDLDLVVLEGEMLFYSALKRTYAEATGKQLRVRRLGLDLAPEPGEYAPDVRILESVGSSVSRSVFEIKLMHSTGKHFSKAGADTEAILAHDASMRDITINSLYIDIRSFSKSGIIDPTGHGHSDLESNTIRLNDRVKHYLEHAASGRKVSEYLLFAIFRVYDFAGRTDGTIEPNTRKLIQDVIDAAASNEQLNSALKRVFIRALREGKEKTPRILRGLATDNLLSRLPQVRETTNPILTAFDQREVSAIGDFIAGRISLEEFRGLRSRYQFSQGLSACLTRYGTGHSSRPGLFQLVDSGQLSAETAADFLVSVSLKDASSVRALAELKKVTLNPDTPAYHILDRVSDALDQDQMFAVDRASMNEAKTAIGAGQIQPSEFEAEKKRLKRKYFVELLGG